MRSVKIILYFSMDFFFIFKNSMQKKSFRKLLFNHKARVP